MDGVLKKKEQELERLEVEEKIAERRKNIAEKRRVEKQMKAGEGKNWKKIFGVIKHIRPNREAIQDLYSMGGSDFKDMSDPRNLRRL